MPPLTDPPVALLLAAFILGILAHAAFAVWRENRAIERRWQKRDELADLIEKGIERL